MANPYERIYSSRNYIRGIVLFLFLILLAGSYKVSGYATLTHEAIIDAAWDKSIVPILKERFPDVTVKDLDSAHGYAYGGAIMPDMGYYPFGNIFFTELLHYVRSGDFVMNLISEAQDLNEYAFALGALAHYVSDRDGHTKAVNLSVSLVYPDVKEKFGDTVTYAEDPVSHRRIEFGFDVIMVAVGKYAPESYHNFIGFNVAVPLLERAFLLTYGLRLQDIYTDIPLAINTFRWSVKTFMPELTNAAWISRKKEIEKSQPGITRRQFNYNLSRNLYHDEWGKNYHKPGAGACFLAIIIKIFPKIGLARILKFKAPTQKAEELFLASFNQTESDYSSLLKKCESNKLHLDNIDFDTGKKTSPGEYKLADDTYKQLLLKLPTVPAEQVNDQIRKNILNFYETVLPSETTEKDEIKFNEALKWLKAGE